MPHILKNDKVKLANVDEVLWELDQVDFHLTELLKELNKSEPPNGMKFRDRVRALFWRVEALEDCLKFEE